MADGKTGMAGNAVPDGVASQALARAPYALVLTNPQLDDNPIVYVNAAFEEITGYSREMAIGRNCRFLQGDDTDQPGIRQLRDAVAERKQAHVVLRNYRADGEQFINRLLIAPLNKEEDDVPYFMGIQTVVPEGEESREHIAQQIEEIQHRVKNHMSMIVGMIRLQARDIKQSAGKEFDTLARRIETLQLLYEEISAADARSNSNDAPVNLGAYLTRVANAIAHIDGRSGVRVNVDADEIEVPVNTATQLGLALSEVMTNAMQHAFVDQESGLVEVRVKSMSGGTLRIQVSDDGVGIPPDVEWPEKGSLGGRIVTQLIRGLDAKLLVERQMSGTLVMIDVPRAHTIAE